MVFDDISNADSDFYPEYMSDSASESDLDDVTLSDELADWACQFNISHAALGSLLQLL